MERFLEAQKDTYDTALAEIKAGRKETHWMWWVFPQYKGLGYSAYSHYFAIESLDEAGEYHSHPVLGNRLRECMWALLELYDETAVEVFGEVDAKKLQSCMTLFYYATGDKLCGKVLERFFDGALCLDTLKLIIESE